MAEKRILVVEDESVIAGEIKRTLGDLGYTVVEVVSSGEEAIEKTSQHNPDLVLMDIVLKGEMDGVQAAEKIRLQHNIPVVYLTAYTDENTMQRAKISEPYGYVVKPFDDRELYTSIEMALYRHEAEEEKNRLYRELEQKNQELQQTNQELEKRVNELSALNHLFQEHLNERFAVVEAYKQVLEGLKRTTQEMEEIRDWAASQPLPDPTDVPSIGRGENDTEKAV